MKIKELKTYLKDFDDEDDVHVDVGDSIWTVDHVYADTDGNGELTIVILNEV